MIVEATNDIVHGATEFGLLKDRIPKEFLYFEDAKKNAESALFPTISSALAHDAQIPWLIEKTIAEFAESVREPFSTLVIAPAASHLQRILKGLTDKGLQNVVNNASAAGEDSALLEGLSLLAHQLNSNLGWRLVAEHYLEEEQLNAAVASAFNEPSQRFSQLVEPGVRAKVKRLRKAVRKLKDGSELDEQETELIFAEVAIDPVKVALADFASRPPVFDPGRGKPAIRNSPIRLSTVQRSKGLAADLVIMTSFDENYFLEANESGEKQITDSSVYKFLVALTRARRKAVIVRTNASQPSTFLNWIAADRLDTTSYGP